METLKDGLSSALIVLIVSVNFLIPLAIGVGLIKLWEWRREHRRLLARVAQLEARQPATEVVAQHGNSSDPPRAV